MSSPPPIRTKLLRILLIPLVSMIALWGVIAYSSIEEIVGISQTQDRWEAIGSPLKELIADLQRERQYSAEAVNTTVSEPLAAQRRITDDKVQRLREVIGSLGLQDDPDASTEVRALLDSLDGLQKLRAGADNGRLTPPLKIIESYNQLIDATNRQFGDRDALSDVSAFQAVRGRSAYSTGAEYIGRQHSIITSTLAHGKMTSMDRAAFVAAFTARRIAFANAERDVGPDLRRNFQQLVAGAAFKRFVAVEDKLFVSDTAGGGPPVNPGQWKNDADFIMASIARDTELELNRAAAEAEELKTGAYRRIGLILALGLIAIVVSIVLSYRFGRSLIDELKRLQVSAVELAKVRLPRLVERLRRGDDVDPATEAPDLASGRGAHTAEVHQVVAAFTAVRRTAVEAAIGQATLRKGVGQVFLNLAWRNQALLHRQLSLLDTMERRVDEPEILEDLFKLDHLTTRMRRHAENLIILSDSAPARRWRDPVPIFDVVRSAVLEVEDYTRVTVAPMQRAPMLVGSAVTDVIHLIAELVENATVFSPPETSVHIRGTTAANGFALEVEDRGLGLNQATLDDFNAKLADPPEFDLAGSDRLGLFVVARLAARHRIKIILRPSPYDGTTAIVLLPSNLLATTDTPIAESTAEQSPQQVGQAGHIRPARPMRALSTVPEAPAGGRPDAPRHTVDRVPEQASTWFDRQNGLAAPTVHPAPAQWTSPEPGPRPGPGPGPAPGAGPGSVPPNDDDLDGLPLRVPQTNLAPQLRGKRSTDRPDVSVRPPEELLELMSSMQQGWQRGRSQVAQGQNEWNRKDGNPDAQPRN